MTTIDPSNLEPAVAAFINERHLATLTLLKADGSPHVTPVGFTYQPDNQMLRVITWADSWKTKHLRSGHDDRVAVGCVDGGRWLTFYGRAVVTDDPARVAEGVRRYTKRYRPPKERTDRVVIEVVVDRIVGRA